MRLHHQVFIFLGLCLLFLPLNANAFYADGLLLNTNVMDFNFAEYDENGKAVSERGVLGGAEVKMGYSLGPIWLGGHGSIIKGTANYNGETSYTKQKHQTETNESIYDLGFEIGRNYETWNPQQFATIYAGLGLHQWVRDIQTRFNPLVNKTVIGLYERYTWLYANVGARGYLFRTANSHTMIEINLLRTIKPILDISFRGQYDQQRVYLGEHYGAKVSIPWRYEMTRRVMLYAEMYYEAWDLGFSNVVNITQDGFVADATQEPRSTSRFAGINIGLFLRFE